MELTFEPRNKIKIKDAKIIWRNFEGRVDDFNKTGNREFTLIIPDMETADQLLNDHSRDGASWNVKIKAPRNEEEQPFIYLPVTVRFNEYGPQVYVESGRNTIRLSEDSVGSLDHMNIACVDLRINPSDSVVNGTAYRKAYLDAIWVVQELDDFAERYAERNRDEDYPCE